MQISAEMRWFWRADEVDLTEASARWFEAPRAGVVPGGGQAREDLYVREEGGPRWELGIKRRGKQPGCEVKGLIGHGMPVAGGPFAGEVELWGKWASAAIAFDERCAARVVKTRWLRKLDFDGETIREIALREDEKPKEAGTRLPTLGCHVERTRVTFEGGVWWTVGFEAFGPLGAVERILHRAVASFGDGAPDFRRERRQSYPAWLAEVAADAA